MIGERKMEYTHNGKLRSHKNNEILSFITKVDEIIGQYAYQKKRKVHVFSDLGL